MMLADLQALRAFLEAHSRLLVLTGAGCSTESGIPDYRDADGAWKRKQPVQYLDFVRHLAVRQRYWARSFAGWTRFAEAQPNAAHLALARLEAAGLVSCLVTQNVDGLHQRGGWPRETFQAELARLNPAWGGDDARIAPDGDADLEGADFSRFIIPACSACAGILKPAVVFFGESVPPERVSYCLERLANADGLLVVGSSLMVRSGYRFALAATEQGIPIAAINRGRTRADDLLTLKVEGNCGEVLSQLGSHDTTIRAAHERVGGEERRRGWDPAAHLMEEKPCSGS